MEPRSTPAGRGRLAPPRGPTNRPPRPASIRSLPRSVAGLPLLLALLLAAGGEARPAVAQGGEDVAWARFDVTLDVLEDGSFRVVERQVVDFRSGWFRTASVQIPLDRTASDRKVVVREEADAGAVTYRGERGSGRYDAPDPGTYRWNTTGGVLDVAWGFEASSFEQRTFVLEYDAAGALRVYPNPPPPSPPRRSPPTGRPAALARPRRGRAAAPGGTSPTPGTAPAAGRRIGANAAPGIARAVSRCPTGRGRATTPGGPSRGVSSGLTSMLNGAGNALSAFGQTAHSGGDDDNSGWSSRRSSGSGRSSRSGRSRASFGGGGRRGGASGGGRRGFG